MTEPTARRHIADAGFHLRQAELAVQAARRKGLRGGDHYLERVERGARNLRRFTKRLEQAA